MIKRGNKRLKVRILEKEGFKYNDSTGKWNLKDKDGDTIAAIEDLYLSLIADTKFKYWLHQIQNRLFLYNRG